MADDTLALQAAVIARLRANAPLTALVGTRVHDEAPANSAFPFVSLGPVFGQPYEAQGVDGWESIVTVDTWSRAFGATELRQMMAAVFAALHNAPLTVSGRALVMLRLIDQRDIAPDKNGTRHGVQRFEALTDI